MVQSVPTEITFRVPSQAHSLMFHSSALDIEIRCEDMLPLLLPQTEIHHSLQAYPKGAANIQLIVGLSERT